MPFAEEWPGPLLLGGFGAVSFVLWLFASFLVAMLWKRTPVRTRA